MYNSRRATSVLCKIISFSSSAMVIGFKLRNQTVSESQAPPSMDRFMVNIEFLSERTSEMPYDIPLQLVENVGAAILEGTLPTTTDFDVLFENGYSLEERQKLTAGSERLVVNTFIIDDFRLENEECFTLRVVMDTHIQEMNFMCNEFNNPVDFFCLHTVCIEDDDG